jgi:hypothetical protein
LIKRSMRIVRNPWSTNRSAFIPPESPANELKILVCPCGRNSEMSKLVKDKNTRKELF